MRPLLAAFLLAACAEDSECMTPTDEHMEEGYLLAEEGFAMSYDLGDECREGRPVDYVLVSDDGFPEGTCMGMLEGCVARHEATGLWRVWILECSWDPIGTFQHERFHVLLDCEYGDSDDGHLHEGWGKVAPL